MHVGVVFPQTEIGNDPGDIRRYAQDVEAAGFEFLAVFDHVLGANPDRPGGWSGPYTYRTPFHEPFVLFGYLAGLTTRLELVTEILVLPQRQTALVAKQAAEVDVLTGGRLRLGVGIGWNAVEYVALGKEFHDRGARVEEQVELLRRLWADDLVVVDGRWERVPDAGINPRPVRGTIPVWMGGTAPAALRRAARIADGWMVNMRLGQGLGESIARMRAWVREAGRDPDTFGIAGRVDWRGDAAQVAADIDGWRRLGATHVSITTMGAGLAGAAAHVAALSDVMAAAPAG